MQVLRIGARKKGITITDLINATLQPSKFQPLLSIANTQKCPEIIYLVKDINTALEILTKKGDINKSVIEDILDNYFQTGAKFQVNLPGRVRQELQERLDVGVGLIEYLEDLRMKVLKDLLRNCKNELTEALI